MKIDIHSTNRKYRVIYADPAWQFKSKKSGGSMKSRAAQVYSVTSIEDMRSATSGEAGREQLHAGHVVGRQHATRGHRPSKPGDSGS